MNTVQLIFFLLNFIQNLKHEKIFSNDKFFNAKYQILIIM